MIEFSDLPWVNACLNSLTTAFLLGGYAAVKTGRLVLHRKLMIAAFLTSTVFLASYLTHKFTMGPTLFQGTGMVRWIYFSILISHTILAVINLPLIIAALVLALRGRFETHKKVTRWAYPIWMYVSVTGVLVYLFLYQWFPA
ncbi:MAG: DUF420 domain-containing protein [Candidatus Methylacidiphilales bacterium]